MIFMKPDHQRLIGLLIESGIYKHPDGRHLYQISLDELQSLCTNHNVNEFISSTTYTTNT